MIRPAGPDDAAQIAGIWNWMIRETLATFTTEEKTVQGLGEMISEREGAVFVDVEQDVLRGFVTYGPFRSGPGYAATCEHSVVVHPEHQKSGVGAALMARAEAAATAQGLHMMVGAISGANLTAIGFHVACGFVECGRMREVGRKAGRWLDLVLMQKVLAPDRS